MRETAALGGGAPSAQTEVGPREPVRSACGPSEARSRRASAKESRQPPLSANARDGSAWGWGPKRTDRSGAPRASEKRLRPERGAKPPSECEGEPSAAVERECARRQRLGVGPQAHR